MDDPLSTLPAGAAIADARLYDVARTHREWLAASVAITRRLLSTEPGDPLELVVAVARDVARADLVAVARPTADRATLRVEVAVGGAADEVTGVRIPVAGSLCGQVLTTGHALRDSWTPDRPGLGSAVSADLARCPVLIVPLVGPRQVDGVIVAARAQDRPAFTDDDLDMLSGFANQASLALELTDARAEQQRTALADDRDRIAADLHDHVIQRLFAAGMSLQSVGKLVGTGTVAGERIAENIANLDETISQIRTTIFQLHRVTGAVAAGLRGRVLDVLADVTPALGFSPATRFAGPLQTTVPDDIGDDLVAVLREALSNVARHAHARSAGVDVGVHDELTLRVVDDGVGITDGPRRSGLATMAARAARHGGSLRVTRGARCGTELTWTVPIP